VVTTYETYLIFGLILLPLKTPISVSKLGIFQEALLWDIWSTWRKVRFQCIRAERNV